MKRSFLFLLLVGGALAQTESQIESDEVKRVGTHINCQCGACSENVNCNMSSGQCHFCKPARTKIWSLQKAGMDDAGIVAWFKKQYGEGIFRHDPNSYFWLIPYLTLGAGALVFVVVVKRLRIAKPVHADPIPERYRDAIEKDTDDLN